MCSFSSKYNTRACTAQIVFQVAGCNEPVSLTPNLCSSNAVPPELIIFRYNAVSRKCTEICTHNNNNTSMCNGELCAVMCREIAATVWRLQDTVQKLGVNMYGLVHEPTWKQVRQSILMHRSILVMYFESR